MKGEGDQIGSLRGGLGTIDQRVSEQVKRKAGEKGGYDAGTLCKGRGGRLISLSVSLPIRGHEQHRMGRQSKKSTIRIEGADPGSIEPTSYTNSD